MQLFSLETQHLFFAQWLRAHPFNGLYTSLRTHFITSLSEASKLLLNTTAFLKMHVIFETRSLCRCWCWGNLQKWVRYALPQCKSTVTRNLRLKVTFLCDVGVTFPIFLFYRTLNLPVITFPHDQVGLFHPDSESWPMNTQFLWFQHFYSSSIAHVAQIELYRPSLSINTLSCIPISCWSYGKSIFQMRLSRSDPQVSRVQEHKPFIYCNYAGCWLHGPEMTLKCWSELWEAPTLQFPCHLAARSSSPDICLCGRRWALCLWETTVLFFLT